MNIQIIKNSYFQVNTYIFELNDKVFVIDPGNNISDILSKLNNKTIDYILLTHGHMDHIYNVKFLVKKYNCKVYASSKDSDFINGIAILDPLFDKNNHNFEYIDYKNFEFEGIDIIYTPGHSKGSVCIFVRNENILFSGDTLFYDSFGRYDFIGGNLNELKLSINLLFSLNESTIIYPGHGPFTTIKREKEHNIIKFY